MNIDEVKKYYNENSDLDFELNVRQGLLKSGFDVKHSGRYVDDFTGKMREYDLLATPRSRVINGMTARSAFDYLELAVEYKHIAEDCPLIIGARDCEYEKCFSMHYVRDNSTTLTAYVRDIKIEQMASLYNAFGKYFSEQIGVEVMQMARGGQERKIKPLESNSAIYDKWSQAINHAIYRYRKIASEISIGSTNGTITVWCQPILVVPNGRLYIANRDDERLTVNEAEGINIKVDYDFSINAVAGENSKISSYFLFTESGFIKFTSMFQG